MTARILVAVVTVVTLVGIFVLQALNREIPATLWGIVTTGTALLVNLPEGKRDDEI